MEGTQRGVECEMHRFGTTRAPPRTTGQWGRLVGWEHSVSPKQGLEVTAESYLSVPVLFPSCENPMPDATPRAFVLSGKPVIWRLTGLLPSRVSEITPMALCLL